MYYTISLAQATAIEKFTLKKGFEFDPFVGEQTNGRFLIEKALVDAYMHIPKVAAQNWGALPTLTHAQAVANLKVVTLP